jgi:branched-chain amino acid transport system substrate-binding protein
VPIRGPIPTPIDTNPDTAFIYFPGPQAGIFAKQLAERGLANSGIKIIGAGDLTDDDTLNASGDQMIGMITAGSYSAAHDSTTNKAYVAAFETANKFRPNVVSLAGYDGMNLIYEALKRTGGRSDGDTLLAAMKGMTWESPRGPMTIDPQTRDVVNNIYIRKVEKINGQLYNTEFATFEAVQDPMKAGTK